MVFIQIPFGDDSVVNLIYFYTCIKCILTILLITISGTEFSEGAALIGIQCDLGDTFWHTQDSPRSEASQLFAWPSDRPNDAATCD